jgi:hypothetical protein
MGDGQQGDRRRQEERLGPREEDVEELVEEGRPPRRPGIGLAAEIGPVGLGAEGGGYPEAAVAQSLTGRDWVHIRRPPCFTAPRAHSRQCACAGRRPAPLSFTGRPALFLKECVCRC